MRHTNILLSTEPLEARLMLASVAFREHLPNFDGHVAEPTSVYASDIDSDGDIDVLSASFGDDKIAWYENVDGVGTFGPQRTITTDAVGARAVLAVDVDGDGDQDVLAASQDDNTIAWYANLDGRGAFGTRVIINSNSPRVQSISAADVDGDGDIDVFSASRHDNTIAWYENMDGLGSFGASKPITTDLFGATAVHAADLDNDGDVDVMGSSLFDGKVVWFENTDGRGTFGSERVINSQLAAPRDIKSGDVDGDGDVDVLAASQFDNKITWYENVDGRGEFGPERGIGRGAREAHAIQPADVDGDNDLDVVSASLHDGRIAWHENTDGQGNFRSHRIMSSVSDEARAVFVADIDHDGMPDVVAAADSITWYRNRGLGESFDDGTVITTSLQQASSVGAADIDGDGDRDVITGTFSDAVAWYENINGSEGFGQQTVIGTGILRPSFVEALDMNGDGHLDVVTWSIGNFIGAGEVAWFENMGEAVSFGPERSIALVVSAAAVDFDRDGDLDFLVRPFGADNGVQPAVGWYPNVDGMGTFGPLQVIADRDGLGLQEVGAVAAADLDADNDLDLIVE